MFVEMNENQQKRFFNGYMAVYCSHYLSASTMQNEWNIYKLRESISLVYDQHDLRSRKEAFNAGHAHLFKLFWGVARIQGISSTTFI